MPDAARTIAAYLSLDRPVPVTEAQAQALIDARTYEELAEAVEALPARLVPGRPLLTIYTEEGLGGGAEPRPPYAPSGYGVMDVCGDVALYEED